MFTQSQKYLALYALQLLAQTTVNCLMSTLKLLVRLFSPRTYMIFDHNNTCVAVVNDRKNALKWKAKGYSVFRSVKTVRESQHVKFSLI